MNRRERDFSEFPANPEYPERAYYTENACGQVYEDQLVLKSQVEAKREEQQAHQEPKLRNARINRIG